MADNISMNMMSIEQRRTNSIVQAPGHVNRYGITSDKPSAAGQSTGTGQPSFAEVFEKASTQKGELVISKHAEMRLKTRNIQITDLQKHRISQALDKAREKGVKDPLVMMDDLALVANTKSRTVITAVSSSELKQNIFTNIDGAVFA